MQAIATRLQVVNIKTGRSSNNTHRKILCVMHTVHVEDRAAYVEMIGGDTTVGRRGNQEIFRAAESVKAYMLA